MDARLNLNGHLAGARDILLNMKRMAAVALFLVFIFPFGLEAKPAPGVSGTLSLVPGLGQLANGDGLEGLGWFSASVGLLLLKDGTARKFGQNLWFYNMYDAYRDAGGSPAARHGLLENYLGNLNPLYAFDIIGTPILALAAASPGNTASNKGAPRSIGLRAVYYSAVGTGEEALFRGFLFPAFSNGLGSKFVGAVLSSAVFSAAHGEGGGAFVVRFLGGLLFCWQVQMHNHDLRPSIFAHTWFDFLLTRKGNIKGEIEPGILLKHTMEF